MCRRHSPKEGTKVILVERTDMLLGSGGRRIMRNNGRYTAAEKC